MGKEKKNYTTLVCKGQKSMCGYKNRLMSAYCYKKSENIKVLV